MPGNSGFCCSVMVKSVLLRWQSTGTPVCLTWWSGTNHSTLTLFLQGLFSHWRKPPVASLPLLTSGSVLALQYRYQSQVQVLSVAFLPLLFPVRHPKFTPPSGILPTFWVSYMPFLDNGMILIRHFSTRVRCNLIYQR